ncbi:MAG: hypothetical protein C0609_05230, partial [Deltaproteobacteria bacterium]
DLGNPSNPGNFLPYPNSEDDSTFSVEAERIAIGGMEAAYAFGSYTDVTSLGSFGTNVDECFSAVFHGTFDISDSDPLDGVYDGMNEYLDTDIPFIACFPDLGETPEPAPLVIFQHGLGSDKSAIFGIADRLAANGIASLAIDAPFHGGRAYDLGGGNYVPFFSANIMMDRLNVYQSSFDLGFPTLFAFLGGFDLNEDTVPDFAPEEIHFGAHSLGSIIGSTYLNGNPVPSKAMISGLSSNLANVLDKTNIGSLGDMVESLGYTKGTAEYYVFLNLAQWLMDPVDGAYMGVGEYDFENMIPRTGMTLAIISESDPVVPESSGRAFLKDAGINLTAVKTTDLINTALPMPGGFLYAIDGENNPIPMDHSFEYYPDLGGDLYEVAQDQIADFFLPDDN